MHYLRKPKYQIFITISILLFLSVNLVNLLGLFNSETSDYSKIYRGINSGFHLFFFGALGIIFNYKISLVNYLIIPVIIHYLINFFKINHQHKTLLTFLLMCTAVIIMKGFFNYRYSITLLPVIIAIIIAEYSAAYPKLLHPGFKKKNNVLKPFFCHNQRHYIYIFDKSEDKNRASIQEPF